MFRISAAAAAVLMTTTALHAGGLDRSGSTFGAIFDEGNVVELSFGSVSPDVSGGYSSALTGGAVIGSGNVAGDYSQVSLSIKTDLTDRLALAVILDQPYGASISYDAPGYPLNGSTAEFESSAVTALLRYRLNDRFSVHGGLRAVTTWADLTVNSVQPVAPALALLTYDADYSKDSALGYVIGAAYEIPEIALRVALTYTSETEFSNRARGVYTLLPLSFTGTPTAAPITMATFDDNLSYTMPQQLALDFQTGVAADTLVFGSVRWTDWDATVINSPAYFDDPIVGHDDDVIAYTLGIGRRFSENFSGAISVGYEASTDKQTSNLAPTDGQTSVQIGGTYTVNNVDLTAGVRWIQIGDATTRGYVAEFKDNTAVALGLSVAYRF